MAGRAIDAIVGHYDAQGKQSIHIEEWGLTIHWDLLTPLERSKLLVDGKTDVDVLIMKATDVDGTKLFDIGDAAVLRRKSDAVLVTKVASAILGQTRVTKTDVEEAEKN